MNDPAGATCAPETTQAAPADPATVSSLHGLWAVMCAAHGSHVAFVAGDETLTYAAWADRAARLTGWLQGVGVAPGDRVAVMLPNGLAYPIAALGVLGAGAVLVNVNPMYVADEVGHQVRDAGARVMIAHPVALPAVLGAHAAGALPELATLVVVGDDPAVEVPGLAIATLPQVIAAAAPAVPVPRGRDDLALLQYTGGTTGRAKGAMLSHGNLLANIAQFDQWYARSGITRPVVILTALPLYHIFAFTANLAWVVRRGGTNVLIADPRDLAGLSAQWQRWGVTVFTAVNTLLNGLTRCPAFAGITFSPDLLTIGGGAAIQPSVAERWHEITGRPVAQGYGLSETAPMVSITAPDAGQFAPTIGQPVAATQVTLRDEAGMPVPDGEVGELCVAGPQVTSGYWRQPAATAAAFTADGQFRTGDLARRLPDGALQIVDRAKDMVLVSGFNVYPNEVEAVAARLDGVVECACVGVPDAHSGESVVLFVVGSDLGPDAAVITRHCREHLAAYKVPRRIVFVPALPKSAVGKILRRELRAAAPGLVDVG